MRNIRRVSLALAFAFTALAAPAARADAPGDAWLAAKGMLPANPYVVLGLNVATIKSSQLFQQLYPKLLAQAGEAQQGLDMVNKECGINAIDTIQGVVVAIDESQKGIILISTKGIEQGKVKDCLTKVGGKGVDGKSSGGAALGKVNTNAAMWGVVVKADQLEPGVNMKAGYGSADITGGNINADLRLILGNAKEASDAVTKANTQLEEAKKGGGVPPALANVMKTVKITSQGDELQVKASMAEKEALGLIGMAMGGK